jgi:hypothetical protein
MFVIFYDHLEYFTPIWHNLLPFDIYFSVLVCLDQEKSGNPARFVSTICDKHQFIQTFPFSLCFTDLSLIHSWSQPYDFGIYNYNSFLKQKKMYLFSKRNRNVVFFKALLTALTIVGLAPV